jgi:hypothetical protein
MTTLAEPGKWAWNPNEPPIVVVFDTVGEADAAVIALEDAGFKPHEIGYAVRDTGGKVAASPNMAVDRAAASSATATGVLEGGMIGGVLGAAVAALIPGLGPLLVGGILASFFGGALAGGAVGGLLGALNAIGIPSEHVDYYRAQLEAGHALVAVKNTPRSVEALRILQSHGGRQIADPGDTRPETESSKILTM